MSSRDFGFIRRLPFKPSLAETVNFVFGGFFERLDSGFEFADVRFKIGFVAIGHDRVQNEGTDWEREEMR